MSSGLENCFTKGQEVEVLVPDTSAWHFATVLKSPSGTKSQVFVELITLTSPETSQHVRERVHVSRVRPLPPQQPLAYFNGDVVEVFHGFGWKKAVVEKILEGSKYNVKIEGVSSSGAGGSIVVERWRLRCFREWVDGVWNPPSVNQKEPDLMQGKTRRAKLDVRMKRRASEVKLRDGMIVEVSSDEEGYEGAWYTAKIVRYLGNSKYLVEYLTLLTDDQKEPLREEAYEQYIRPCPPSVLKRDPFKRLEIVDAWDNEGWWVGKISRVLGGSKYVVQFTPGKQDGKFEHADLRPHQDWIDGKWVIASKECSSKWKLESREVHSTVEATVKNTEFRNGTVVEVKSNISGFEGSWFSAKIVGSLKNDKFLVEYLTLRTDDDTKPLIEVAHASCLRPCPAVNVHRADFNMHDVVDAWHNEGWWVGFISKVQRNSKYAVFFDKAGEELEFHHSDLRPHQEWINGNWIASSKESSSELALKCREVDLILKASGRNFGIAYFRKRTKVEVKSDISGFEGSWFTAKIDRSLGNDMFVVEYLTLRTDEGNRPLNEEAHASCIRPCPPDTKRSHFTLHEIVDAWHNDGWWLGLVSHVHSKLKYSVYFHLTGEELEFSLSHLRPHHEWINGKWINASKGMKV